MSELEDKISQVLSNPEQMAQISRIAQSLMGGEGAADTTPPGQSPSAPDGAGGLDAAMIARLARAAGAGGQDAGGKSAALLAALRPYLSEKRRDKLQRAMKLARLARLARFALADGEGGENA